MTRPEAASTHPPTVTILYPANGTSYMGVSYPSMEAIAIDFEDGNISAAIQWSSSVDGPIGTGGLVNPFLTRATHTITATVEDSDGESGSAEITVTLEPNVLPSVEITSPAADTSIAQGSAVSFSGTASDVESGNLTASIQWHSSIDGELGTGAGVSAVLSAGTHVIAATVVDPDQDEGADSVTVTVDGGLPPDSTRLSSRQSHTCALDTEGAAYCWGLNLEGGIGDGTRTQADSPTEVSGEDRFVSISTGAYYTCALTGAGVAYCWGINWEGGPLGAVPPPVLVPTPLGGGHTFAKLSAGAYHACGLKQNGVAYCWGKGSRLGDGAALNGDAAEPRPVAGGHVFVDLTATDEATCAIEGDGSAWCWGSNGADWLGVGEMGGIVDEPALVPGGLQFVSIAGGAAHICGLTSDGMAYCWGYNEKGAVGDGTYDLIVNTPTPVLGGLSFVHLALGPGTSCGISGTGVSYCWGDNGYGELGIGLNDISTNAPQVVYGGHSFEILAPGYRHTCGTTTDGTTYCWGDNYEGGLGDGGVTDRTYAPQPTEPF